eukprot:585772-Pelagomonas_calceolata.AAC.1
MPIRHLPPTRFESVSFFLVRSRVPLVYTRTVSYQVLYVSAMNSTPMDVDQQQQQHQHQHHLHSAVAPTGLQGGSHPAVPPPIGP